MYFIKINNLVQPNGRADYKGLEIKEIVSGTQIYPHDENIAYFYYGGELTLHDDVEVITELQYQQVLDAHNEYLNNIVTPEEKIETLEQQLIITQEAIDFLIMMGGM